MKKQNTINITKITDSSMLCRAKFNYLKYFNEDFIIWNTKKVCSNTSYSNHCNNLIKDICEKIIINLQRNNMQFNEAAFKIDLLDIVKSTTQVEEGIIILNALDLLKEDFKEPYKDLSIIKRILNYFSNEKFKAVIIPETVSSEECFLIIEDNEHLTYKDVESLKNVFNENISIYEIEFINAETNFTKNFYFISSYDCFDVENSMTVTAELTVILQKNYNISIDDIYNSQIILEIED